MPLDKIALYEKFDQYIGEDLLTKGERMNELLKDTFESITHTIEDAVIVLTPLIDSVPELLTIYNNLTQINAVYADLPNIDTVAGDTVQINALYSKLAELLALHTELSKLLALHAKLPELLALHGELNKLVALFDNLPGLVAIYNNLGAILNLNSNLSHVTTVEAALVSIQTVSDSIANVNIAAADIANINTTAENIASVNTTATNMLDVKEVAENMPYVQTAASKMADIEAAPGAALDAATARDKAQDWADEAEDVEVETGQFSAKHWAAKSDGSATAASASKDLANDYANKAEDVEVEPGKYSAKHYAEKAEKYYQDWYGIEWDITAGAIPPTRIGNLDMHKVLPIQENIYHSILNDDGTENYKLDPADWSKKLTGGAADLSGADGMVMGFLPNFYYKFEAEGTKRRFKASEMPLLGFTYFKGRYGSSYQASLNRTNNKLASVKNTSADYRGGDNTSAWDLLDKTLLGMPATSISRTNFRNYSRNRGAGWEMYHYEFHLMKAYLIYLEFASFNTQLPVNAARDANGFRQGGLGDGVTTLSGSLWNTWKSYNPFIPCGHSDSLASGTGEVAYEMPAGYGAALTVQVNRWRGFEIPVGGHIYENSDQANIRIAANDDPDPTSKLYVAADPADWNDSNYTNYELVGELARENGYITEMINGAIVPRAVGGGSSTFFCDYFYTSLPADGASASLRTLLFGGIAYYSAYAGVGYSISYYWPSTAFAFFGSRLCFIPA